MITNHKQDQQEHISVLLNEAIDSLAIIQDGIYVDGTYGRGGHSKRILEKLGTNGRLLVIDQDPMAVAHANELAAHDHRITVCHSNFSHIDAVLTKHRIAKVDGILLDLGVSSPQLDQADRGFSFSHDGPLDMRMDNSTETNCRYSAEQWINEASPKEIADVLWQYGEERYSHKIARALVAEREKKRITRTAQLAEIIKEAHPNWPKNKHPATKSFMAIRLFINQELEVLNSALNKSIDLLNRNGRLVVISFHSLEDRIVKNFMNKHAKLNDSFLDKLPITESERMTGKYSEKIQLKIVQKPIKAGIMELDNNVRARSAILRVAAKI